MIILAGLLFSVFMFIASSVAVQIGVFIDPFSMVFILLPVIFFIFASKSGKHIGRYIASSFKKDYQYSLPELDGIANAAKGAFKVTLGAGLFGFIAGLVALLGNLDSISSLGQSISVCLLTLFYSIAIGFFIFLPLQYWADNKARAIK